MNFPKVIRRKELLQAAFLGSAAGLVGVIFFVILLNSMNSTETSNEEVIPVQSNEAENTTPKQFSEQFFANQHGMFSSSEAANAFISGYPSLNKSTIVEVDGSFYVWSSISTTKESVKLSENPSSFVKPFKFIGDACEESSIQDLPAQLKSEERSKFYFEKDQVPDSLPQDWKAITVALSSISEDLSVIRLHLLSHYFSENDCLKIQF